MSNQENFKGAFVPKEHINNLMETAEYKVFDNVFDKLTIVVAKFDNGFTLVGSSGCVNPDNYNREIGVEICKEQIKSELWKLEGYALQDRVNKKEGK